MLNSRVAYRVYSDVFSPDDCVKIEEAARKRPKLTGKVAEEGVKQPEIVNREIRDSDIYFFAEEWIARKIQEVVVRANTDAGWNLNVTDLEPFQFGEYGTGGYYDWHLDSLGEPYTDKGRLTGKVRKLSMSVLINDPGEFEGGEFEAGHEGHAQKPCLLDSRAALYLIAVCSGTRRRSAGMTVCGAESGAKR